ncbi:ClpX C4-type zinc finger protein [Mycobacterium sp.]|uniref:ClpX C4-type zinc finger protein n=1 Tax=Mycobacterium sp. TaxID=1785 RepID=UPI0025EDE2C7|nr:ClpX C4-type zinc finger protein [Mycobacterium sp.]MBW0012792.1 ClpX C4-type zinc finger protein [Mycobacterium sp.]
MNPTANQTTQIWCSFCGKSHTAVDKLVAGPGVQICNHCVDKAQAIIKGYRDKPAELRMPIWEAWSDKQMLDHIPRMAAVADHVETELGSWVRELRRRGMAWSTIGAALGITRQSAWERFSERQ